MSEWGRDAIETLEFVTRSPCRIRILETLRDGDPVSRDTLQDEVDVVRTTLQRNLTGLIERGLIRERDRRYEITPAGSLAAAGVSTALERVGAADRLRPVLERLPATEFGFDIERLVDATVIEATTANPYAPVNYHADSLTDVDHVRMLLPATGANSLESSRGSIDAGATFDVIATTSVAETLQTEPSVADEFATIADDDGVSLSVVEDEISFFLGVIDDAVQIGVHNDSGMPTALLETTDDDVREWAIDRFEAIKRRSTPIGDYG
ncbi:transcriptional regulator [Natrinema sp. 1APR25-10V2]|uniref:helix-turn-helix transcriptional regulator n=1 Tax=Natrinema sp. 1APR25-10V2 TaxID=2951081 RepID=UPI002874F4BA|nr:transcriptional regulator [Natrinema sp. 1APR25-10V2]MDS0474770.1 transcriptional regulator [Natrinema sp. 1APR25-10V2]